MTDPNALVDIEREFATMGLTSAFNHKYETLRDSILEATSQTTNECLKLEDILQEEGETMDSPRVIGSLQAVLQVTEQLAYYAKQLETVTAAERQAKKALQ